MTRGQRETVKDGDELIITQHGFDRGCKCVVLESRPNDRQIVVRVSTPKGEYERLMSYTSLKFPDKDKYMTISNVSALSFHEKWDGREDYFEPGYCLSDALLRKWLNLGLIKGTRFASNSAAGYTWGIPITELPKIRSFFENPPNLKGLPKITYVSEDFISWRKYMDSQDEYHV